MLRINAVSDPNYYLKAAHELDSVGSWQGNLAQSLDLSGPDLEAFKALAGNRTPDGAKLTQRDMDNRRPAYDLTFAEPKSVSIMEQVAGDRRIALARADSIAEVMAQVVEPLAAAKAWAGPLQSRATTGNLAYLAFDHQLGRPVNGTPDPAGHTHVVALNATERKGKRYALEIRPIHEAAPLIQAAWHATYARKLQGLGYETRATKDAFEIVGVWEKSIRTFSRRTDQVEGEQARREASLQERIGKARSQEELAELTIKLAKVKHPKAKAGLGPKIRERKAEIPDPDTLRATWIARLTPAEKDAIRDTRRNAVAKSAEAPLIPAGRVRATEADCRHLDKALSRLLKAHSAVTREKLLTQALKDGVGEVTLPGLVDALDRPGIVQATVNGMQYVSTDAALDAEDRVMKKAAKGDIRLKRLEKGEEPLPEHDEVILKDPTFAQLAAASQSADKLLVCYPWRDYRDKASRGDPNVWLDDLAGLKNHGQMPPPSKLVEKVITVSKQVAAKLWHKAARKRRHGHLMGHLVEASGDVRRKEQAAGRDRGIEV